MSSGTGPNYRHVYQTLFPSKQQILLLTLYMYTQNRFICISNSYTVFVFTNFTLILIHRAYYYPLSRTGTGLLKLMCKCNIVSNRRQMALFAFKMRALTKYPTFVLPRIGIYIGIYYWKCHSKRRQKKVISLSCVCMFNQSCMCKVWDRTQNYIQVYPHIGFSIT